MFRSHQDYEKTFLTPFEILEHGQLPIDQRVFNTPSKTPIPKKRPGKPPAKGDSELSEAELRSRNRRRQSNKRAAQRGRNRIANTIAGLESEVQIIATENGKLESEIDFYRD